MRALNGTKFVACKSAAAIRARLARRRAGFRLNEKADYRFHRNKGYMSGLISFQLIKLCLIVSACY